MSGQREYDAGKKFIFRSNNNTYSKSVALPLRVFYWPCAELNHGNYCSFVIPALNIDEAITIIIEEYEFFRGYMLQKNGKMLVLKNQYSAHDELELLHKSGQTPEELMENISPNTVMDFGTFEGTPEDLVKILRADKKMMIIEQNYPTIISRVIPSGIEWSGEYYHYKKNNSQKSSFE